MKKPLLDATSKPKSKFGDFTAGYRQSTNVDDRRGESGLDEAYEIMGKRMERMPDTSARKADPEEAIRKTHEERK